MSDGMFVTAIDLGVQNVHLISGEDIIGRVYRDAVNKEYRIENPVLPNIAPDPQTGNFRVGLLPLRPYLEKMKSVSVPENMVIYLVPVGERMEKLFNQYTSDIVVASANVLKSMLDQQ